MSYEREVLRHTTKDENGNERVYERSTVKRRIKPKIAFCHMMFQDLGRLYDLQDNQLKVLIKLASNMDYDNIVRVSGYDRKVWSKEMKMTYQTFNVAISKLKASGLLLRLGEGAYQIDPEVFNMGQITDSLEKAVKYNAFFQITYKDGENGVERKVKLLKIDVDDIVDLETGETVNVRNP